MLTVASRASFGVVCARPVVPLGSGCATLRLFTNSSDGSGEKLSPVERLVEGFRNFKDEFYVQKDKRDLFQKLAIGQSPKTLLIGCADSRVDPAIVTQCGPGELFILRNIAAIVPPYSTPMPQTHHATSAGLEYGVRVLQVENIVVMGHAKCGGVAALGDPESIKEWKFQFVEDWVRMVYPALQAVDSLFKADENFPAELRAASLEKAVVMTSVSHLLTYPWIKERVLAGKLQLHGWYFDLEAGQLLAFDPFKHRFMQLDRLKDVPEASSAFLDASGKHMSPIGDFLESVRTTVRNDCTHSGKCSL